MLCVEGVGGAIEPLLGAAGQAGVVHREEVEVRAGGGGVGASAGCGAQFIVARRQGAEDGCEVRRGRVGHYGLNG